VLSLDMAKSMFRFALLHRSISDLLASIRWSLHIGVARDIGLLNENSPNDLVEAIADTLSLRGGAEGDYVNYLDVEGYLRRKGAFYFDSRVVGMLKRTTDFGSQMDHSHQTLDIDTPSTRSTSDQDDLISMTRGFFHPWNTTLGISVPSDPAPGIERESLSPERCLNAEKTTNPNLEVITLNIKTLAQNLATVSLCLGRGPAFLPADLDRAIEASRVEAVY